MDKLLLFLLSIGLFASLYALQLDEERAMVMLFSAKHALNYAVHAGALQLDQASLASGRLALDDHRARAATLAMLESNLKVGTDNVPLPRSPLKDPVRIIGLDVINADRSFPYDYRAYGFQETLARPGVMLTIRVRYPNLFPFVHSIVWTLHSSAEIVY